MQERGDNSAPFLHLKPFVADPGTHIFLKPNVTKAAAYGFVSEYERRPSWKVYEQLLKFAERIDADLKKEGPLDMINIQSFIWVVGSEEYKSIVQKPAI